jgi:glycosyltransferase involved in cell wall biosynthesis
MERKGKLLMLVENLPVPTDPRVWSEAITLRNHGFKVSIICPKGANQCQESYICIDNIHIYRYRLPIAVNKPFAYITEYNLALIKTFWLSLRVLFLHGFDIIHAANPPDLYFLIGLFYRLFGKKYVYDQHDLVPELSQVVFRRHTKLLYKLLLFLEACSYRVANIVIVTNLSQKQIAIKRGHCPLKKVFVVRNGPDLKQMELVRLEPELRRGRRYLLAFVGVMGVQDGVQYALRALYELVHRRDRQDISFVLIGDGSYVPALFSLTQELGLEEYVCFAGWMDRNDILRYLTVADVGLSPDPQNGLNEFSTTIKTLEYMAMGKPIVAFDLAETRFSAQGAALYAVPNHVEDFANKIEVLLDNEELRLKMGAIGRKRIEKELSWDHTKAALLLAYQHL